MRLDNGIEVITGAMFGEKSGELIRRLSIAEEYEGKKIIVYKPKKDTRTKDYIRSRVGTKLEATVLDAYIDMEDLEGIIEVCKKYDVVGFDEVQFFHGYVVDLVELLARRGKRVIVAGLNKTSDGLPFGCMPNLLAIADKIDIVYPVCVGCRRNKALYSHRVTNEVGEVVIGSDNYIPLCRSCKVEREITNGR